ncbi:unnamed protein product [Rotaria magnacalcarata]|uniref:Cardiolipin synthase N-terminal domain-containing protein n=1 Tax=Rotaria magnacalcarata TaxID=392030 RepID=A0A816QI44_9BILA|nr:unnamed protein product [Rotaria magnacalcarata]CAF1319018.1 unnamed protein product [Rotaria magnacalcarata]CAF1941406.1 unnamed protein product [Rotaria magnacalcarata]CAF2062116.1 unnamed protein product [Rotaria magnacalcarata]CAF2176369.1 unnamed protein product [Rotaria magnacalcarata]
MGLLINFATVSVLILSCVKFVSAEAYYIGPTVGGIIGLIILVLDIIAAIEILRSDKPIVEKILWILFIVFCPIIGLVAYLLCGRTRSVSI